MDADKILENIETGASLNSGTTVGGNTAIHKGNMSTELDADTVGGLDSTTLNRTASSSKDRHLERELLGLQLWHPFESLAGGETDDASGVQGVTQLNGSWSSISGKYGNAIDFGTSDDFAGTRLVYDKGGGALKHGLTVCCWMNISGSSSGDRYISCDLSDWWGLWDDTGGDVQWRVNDSGGNATVVTDTSRTLDTWEHWAGVVDIPNTEIRLYKNGSLSASTSFDSSWGSGSVTRYVNINSGSEDNDFNKVQSGLSPDVSYDDVRVYHRTLSQSTIQDIYNNNA